MPTYPKGNKFITKFMVEGKRPSKITDTRAEGEAWELEARAALKRGKPIPGVEGNRLGGKGAGTLQHLYRETVASRWEKNKGSDSQIKYAGVFVREVGPNTDEREAFSQEMVDKFFTYLNTARKVTPATLNRYKSAIHVMFDRAKRKYPDLKAPVFEKYKEKRGRFRFFSEQEEESILNLWRMLGRTVEVAFFIFLVETGARTFSEGLSIKWDAVFSDRILLWDTKTGTPRSVPLSEPAKKAIEPLRNNGLAGPFSSLTRRGMRSLWEHTRNAIPSLQDAVLYATRHTFASRMVMKGLPLPALKKLLGHTDIKMTERYAIFEDGAAFDAALAAMNRRAITPFRLTALDGGKTDDTQKTG